MENCTGPNFLKFMIFVQFFKGTMHNNYEEYVRNLFLEKCYRVADNMDFVQACDALERDIIDMVWKGYYLYFAILKNQKKYLHVVGEMPAETFKDIMADIKYNTEPFWTKLLFLNEYHDKALVLLKVFLEEKWKEFYEKAEDNQSLTAGLPIFHDFQVNETTKQEEPVAPEEQQIIAQLKEKLKQKK